MSGFLHYPGMSPAELAIMQQQQIIQNSLERQTRLKAAEEAAFAKVETDAKNKQIMAEHLRENEIAAKREEARMRDESKKSMEAELKAKFMGLPGSTESGWLVAKARLIENHFIQLMNGQASFEEREKAKYPPM